MPMWLNLEEISTLVNQRQARLKNWIVEQGLPAVEVGGKSRVNKTDLLEWALAHRVAVDPEIFHWEREGPERSLLSEAVDAGGFRDGIEVSDATAAVLSVLDGLPMPERIDRAGLASLMLARVSHTFLHAGDGLLIPGPKAPLVLPLDRPALSVGVFARPVALGEGRPPVRTLLLLASPTIRSHLRMLARLSVVLAEASFREDLARSTEPTALRTAFQRFETRTQPVANGELLGVTAR